MSAVYKWAKKERKMLPIKSITMFQRRPLKNDENRPDICPSIILATMTVTIEPFCDVRPGHSIQATNSRLLESEPLHEQETRSTTG